MEDRGFWNQNVKKSDFLLLILDSQSLILIGFLCVLFSALSVPLWFVYLYCRTAAAGFGFAA